MRNPLQDQLLKAGLVKKSKVAEVVREQARQRKGKGKDGTVDQAADTAAQAQRQRVEKAERDRELAARRNAQARATEVRTQVQQIVASHRVAHEGDIAYRFLDGDVIRQLWVDAGTRSQLARGSLVVVREGEGHALVPRAAADRIRERDASFIVLDHANGATPAPDGNEDPHYAKFQVPDDLIW